MVVSSGCSGIGIDPNTFKNSISLQVPITQAQNVYMTAPAPTTPVNASMQNINETPTPTPTKSRFVYV